MSLVCTPQQWAEQYKHHAALGQHKQYPLQVAAMLGMSEPMATRAPWPTPDAGMFNTSESVESFEARRARVKATGINGNGMGTPLAMAVKMWPTPRAAAPRVSGAQSHALANYAVTGTLSVLTLEEAISKHDSDTKRLSPAWVETLMGFPPGWTDGPPVPARRNTNGSRRGRSKKQSTEPQD